MFHLLRKHRRLLSTAVLATVLIGLSAALVSCLLAAPHASAMPMVAAGHGVQLGEAAGSTAVCPDGACPLLQGDRQLTADHAVVPAVPEPPLIALFLALLLVLSARRPQRQPAPHPWLPAKASPFLRFYALRI